MGDLKAMLGALATGRERVAQTCSNTGAARHCWMRNPIWSSMPRYGPGQCWHKCAGDLPLY